MLTCNPKTELKEEKLLEGIREISIFLVNKDRVSETIDRPDEVPRCYIAAVAITAANPKTKKTRCLILPNFREVVWE